MAVNIDSDTLLTPARFHLVVESTKKLCQLDSGSNLNFGVALGHLLGHVLIGWMGLEME